MDQASNPYRPPTAEVDLAQDEDAPALALAGKGRRFLTWVVDYAGFMVLGMLIGMIMGIVFGRGSLRYLDGGWSYVFGFVVMSAYYVFFESLFGRTPGKILLGTKVVDLKGGDPTLGAIVKRTLARFVPFEGLTFFAERGFHDRVSKTIVIRRR